MKKISPRRRSGVEVPFVVRVDRALPKAAGFLREVPQGRVRFSDPRLRSAFLVAALLAVVWVFFWPRTMINGDEYLYAGQARTLLYGHILPQYGDAIPAPLAAPDSVLRYPLGWPLFLLPAAAFGFRAMFFMPCLFQLLGVIVFARLLVRRDIGAHFCIAWALWPALLPFARTLMSDVPTATLILCAVDAWEEDRPALAGIILGLSIFFRVASVLPALGIGLVALTQHPRKALAWLVPGGVLGALGILVGNQLMHGDPLRSSYSAAIAGQIAASHLLHHSLIYLAALIFFPPFPLLAFCLAPRKCERWILAFVPAFLFVLVYDYQDHSIHWYETLVGGQRLLLSGHALLLIATSRVWAAPVLDRFRALAPPLAALGFLASIGLTRHLYQRYEPALARLGECHPRSIAYNTNAARVALSLDAASYRMIEEADPQSAARPADLAIFAARAPTNQALAGGYVQPFPDSLRAFPCERVGEFWIFDRAGGCFAKSERCADLP